MTYPIRHSLLYIIMIIIAISYTFKTSYRFPRNQSSLKAGHLDSASLHLDDFAAQNFVCLQCHIHKQACFMSLYSAIRLSSLLVKPSTY